MVPWTLDGFCECDGLHSCHGVDSASQKSLCHLPDSSCCSVKPSMESVCIKEVLKVASQTLATWPSPPSHRSLGVYKVSWASFHRPAATLCCMLPLGQAPVSRQPREMATEVWSWEVSREEVRHQRTKGVMEGLKTQVPTVNGWARPNVDKVESAIWCAETKSPTCELGCPPPAQLFP